MAYDTVIIGAGIAGCTAAIYASRKRMKFALITEKFGGQFLESSQVLNYPGIKQTTGVEFSMLMREQLEFNNVKAEEGAAAKQIVKKGRHFIVRTNKKSYETKTVIIATGARARELNVPGEQKLRKKGVTYCAICDGPLFKGRKVIIVGGGNSAVTEALHLHNIGVQVTMVHRRDTLRAQEHLTKNLSVNKIPVLFDTEVKEIRGKDRVEEVLLYNLRTKETKTMKVDGVFIAIGYTPAVELAKKLGIELTPEGYIKRDSRHRTNIPGIYSAGDVEGGYKQIVTATGQGAEAALAIFENLVNPYWKSKQAAA